MFTTLAMWWRDLRRAVCSLAPVSRQRSSSDGARSGKVVDERTRTAGLLITSELLTNQRSVLRLLSQVLASSIVPRHR